VRGSRARRAIADAIAATPAGTRRVVVATGRCVGEGFDDARLDTLFLALPVAWKGTLQQYAGRLHPRTRARQKWSSTTTWMRASLCWRMHQKRLAGYRAMGYVVAGAPADPEPPIR
jgi:hypothetical protein